MDQENKEATLNVIPAIQKLRGKKDAEIYMDGVIDGYYLREQREHPEEFKEKTGIGMRI